MNQAKPKIRLYIPDSFHPGGYVTLAAGQAHYLAQVMRLKAGDEVAVFGGEDGEWRAQLADVTKKAVTLQVKEKLRDFQPSPDLWLAFAPIKGKTELVVEKAAELGVSMVLVVFMKHSVVRSINREKLEAHAVEAAEQCERLDVPAIEERKDIGALLASWPKDRTLLYGDESGHGAPLKELLNSLPPCGGGQRVGGDPPSMNVFSPLPNPPPQRGEGKERSKYGVLVGPEGGFSSDEHKLLRTMPFVKAFGMGPRILRADTAAVAALSCLQAWLGDWEQAPHFEAAG